MTKPFGCGIMITERNKQEYRSGHNEAVLKTVWVKAHGGSNPSSCANETPERVFFCWRRKRCEKARILGGSCKEREEKRGGEYDGSRATPPWRTPNSLFLRHKKHPRGCFFVGEGREDKFLIIPVLSSAFFYKVCYNRGENDLGACQYESASLWMAAFDIHSR